jgi:predicted metal-dependent peptidase
MEQFKNEFEVKGFGGTDFRPAFQYISQKQRSGELANLRGMLYFTDGYGIYPVQKPAYATAFVFAGEYDSSIKVPGWAIRVEINEEQLNGGHYGH